MQRAATADRAPDDRRTLELAGYFASFLDHRIDKTAQAGASGDGNLKMCPTDNIGLDELQMGPAIGIDINLITAALAVFSRMTALGITRVNNHCRLARQNRTRMDVSERPIIKSGVRKLLYGCRRIIRVPCLSADVRMQDGNRIR